MSSLLAGIDWSTKAIHAALIPLDPDHGDPDVPPVTFRTAKLSGHDTVTRCQHVPEAMIELLRPVTSGRMLAPPTYPDRTHTVGSYTYTAGSEVSSVWIEEAYGNHRTADRALLPIQGAIIASCRHRSVATLTAVEWRKQLGLGRLSKEQAIQEARSWYLRFHDVYLPRELVKDAAGAEHYAEALLLALAAREITWRAAA